MEKPTIILAQKFNEETFALFQNKETQIYYVFPLTKDSLSPTIRQAWDIVCFENAKSAEDCWNAVKQSKKISHNKNIQLKPMRYDIAIYVTPLTIEPQRFHQT